MALLAADTTRKTRGNWKNRDYPVGVDIIYSGALCVVSAAGYLLPATDTASERVVGIAAEKVDNSGGSAGDKTCQVSVPDGAAEAVFAGTFAQTDVQEIVYASNDNDVGTPGNDPGNTNVVGRMEEYISATLAWIGFKNTSVTS